MGTYWTTLITDDPALAQLYLSLPSPPVYRVGGFQLKDLDVSLIKWRGIVAPAYGQKGGAEEILITGPIPVLSIFDMSGKRTLCSVMGEVCILEEETGAISSREKPHHRY
ncbi:MAG: hypothetical protein ABDH32_07005 [Candidatus Caldarchaeales archaeon]